MTRDEAEHAMRLHRSDVIYICSRITDTGEIAPATITALRLSLELLESARQLRLSLELLAEQKTTHET